MEKTLNKKDPKQILKIVLMATGFLTTLLAFIWIILEFTVGYKFFAAYHQVGAFEYLDQWYIDFTKVVRQFATAPIITGLITGSIMIPYSILKTIAIDKKNLKEEILISVINFVVAILLFAFAIVTISSVFDADKWTTYLNYNSMAIILVTSLTAAITSSVTMTKQWKGQSQFNGSYRGFALSSAIITFAAATFVILIAAASGCNEEVLKDNEILRNIHMGNIFIAGCISAMLGGSAILLLIMLAFAIIKSTTGDIIRWAITGGLAFVLFVTFAVFCPSTQDTSRWANNHMTASVICLFSWIALMVGGIMGLVQTKRIISPKVKSKPALKAK